MNVATAGLLAAIMGPVAHLYARDQFDQKRSLDEIEKAKNRIKKRHGVAVNVSKIVTLPHGLGRVTITSNDSAYVRMCAIREFERMANIYPPDTLMKFFQEVHLGEIPSRESANGLMSRDGKSLVIGMDSLFNSYFTILGRVISTRTSHHEIGHGLTKEYIFNRALTQEFEAMNPEKDAYLGIFFSTSEFAKKIHQPIPGFARAFGKQAAWEDMATILELLFRGEKAVEARLALEDSELAPSEPWRGVLRKKIVKVKEIVERSVPGMNDRFWRDVATDKMNDPIGYWNSRGVYQKNT